MTSRRPPPPRSTKTLKTHKVFLTSSTVYVVALHTRKRVCRRGFFGSGKGGKGEQRKRKGGSFLPLSPRRGNFLIFTYLSSSSSLSPSPIFPPKKMSDVGGGRRFVPNWLPRPTAADTGGGEQKKERRVGMGGSELVICR